MGTGEELQITISLVCDLPTKRVEKSTEVWSRVMNGYLPTAETLSVLVISRDGFAASCNLKTINPITTLASVDLNEIVIS